MDLPKYQSLIQWLQVYGSNDLPERMVENISVVLNKGFGSTWLKGSDEAKVQEVLNCLENIHGSVKGLTVETTNYAIKNDEQETLMILLELVLCSTIHCETKDDFVRDMLTLDSSIQVHLMGILEAHMLQLQQKSVSKEDCAGEVEDQLYSTKETELKRLKRENAALKDELNHVNNQVDGAIKDKDAMEIELEKIKQHLGELQLRYDDDTLKNEKIAKEDFEFKLQEKQEEVNTMTSKYQKALVGLKEVEELRDEVDLLLPAAKKVSKLEANIAKYKERLDEASALKEQKKKVEAANQELIKEKLSMETDLRGIPGLRKKLEEYKNSNTDLAVKVSEMEALIQTKDNAIETLTSEAKFFKDRESEQVAAQRDLQETLRDVQSSQSEDNAFSSSASMGCGVTELNPVLTEQLERLKFENEALRGQLSGESNERLESLQDSLDDAFRLKKSFEDKYFSTKAALDEATTKNSNLECKNAAITETLVIKESNILELEGAIKELKLSLESLNSMLVETKEKYALEVRSLEISLEENNNQATEKYENLELMSAKTIEKLHLDFEIMKSNAECKNMEFEEALCRQHLAIERERSHAEETLKRIEGEHETTMSMWSDEIASEKERMKESMNSQDITFKELLRERDDETKQLKQLLDKEKTKFSNLSQTMDDFKTRHSVSNEEYESNISNLSSKLSAQKVEIEELSKAMEAEHQSYTTTIDRGKGELKRLRATISILTEKCGNKDASIQSLESEISHLKSKFRLVDRERTMLSSQVGKQRETDYSQSSRAHQTETQLRIVRSELESLTSEFSDLQEQQSKCTCDLDNRGSSSKMTGYVDSLRQKESIIKQLEKKRREVLLVNAQLVQDQQQFELKISSLLDEVLSLQNSLKHYKLKEERLKISSKNVEPESCGVPQNSEDISTDVSASSTTEKENVLENYLKPDNRSPSKRTTRGRRRITEIANRKRAEAMQAANN